MYASYLLNILCNDEKALGLACKIIIHEYKSNRIELDDRFYNIIVDKLHYEIRKKHDLEIVWLIYLLKYTDFLITQELHKKIIESQCDLAIIVIIEEWILLYQIALHYPEKKGDFYAKLSIVHNQEFYNKLFEKNFKSKISQLHGLWNPFLRGE